jgi:hypothetical protein
VLNVGDLKLTTNHHHTASPDVGMEGQQDMNTKEKKKRKTLIAN